MMARITSLLTRLESLLLLSCAGLFFIPLGTRALWDSDEGRYAEIAREMLASHQWLIPHLNGVLYFEKPPLTYWLTGAGLALFGDNAFGARFFSALFGLFTVAVVFRLGRYWKNERTGLLAGLILATSTGFFILTQYLVVDMILTFWLTLALDAMIHLQCEEDPQELRKATLLLAGAVAGAFLTKGLIALLLPGAILTLSFIFNKSLSRLWKMPWIAAGLLFMLLAAPWFLWVTSRYPFFAFFFFIHEHFARYFTQVHQRAGPLYYFVPVIFVGFLPWIFFLPAILRQWFKRRGAVIKKDPAGLLLLVWSGFIFLFFSFSESKLPAYMLPIFPALALLAGHFFDERIDAPLVPPWISWGLDALLLFFIGLLVLLKRVPGPEVLQVPPMNMLVEQGSLFGLTLALCVLILVSVWGTRKPLAAMGGILMAQVMFLSSLAALAPVLDPWLSTQPLGQIIATRARPEDPVVVYGVSYETYAQTLPFYTQRRIALYGPSGELTLGASHAPDASDWFADGDGATERIKHVPVGSWVVTNEEYWNKLRDIGVQNAFELVAKSGKLFLLQRAQ